MKKLLAVASVAAFAAYPAAACDWTRAASASDPVVVATAAEQTAQAAPAAPEARSVTVDASDRKPIGEQAALVLITDRH